jgi:hypothetical protein
MAGGVLLPALGLGCAGLAGAPQEGRAGTARVALRCADPAAEVTVDGVPQGRVSDYAGGPDRQLQLSPGSHEIVLRAAGRLSTRELAVGPGDALTVPFDLPPPALEAAPQAGAPAAPGSAAQAAAPR